MQSRNASRLCTPIRLCHSLAVAIVLVGTAAAPSAAQSGSRAPEAVESIAVEPARLAELRAKASEIGVLVERYGQDQSEKTAADRARARELYLELMAAPESKLVVWRVPYPTFLNETAAFPSRNPTPRAHNSYIDEAISNTEAQVRDLSVQIAASHILCEVEFEGPLWAVAAAVDLFNRELGHVSKRANELRGQLEMKRINAATREEEMSGERTFSLDWKGGSLGDLVDLVRNACHSTVNVAFGRSEGDVPIKDLPVLPIAVSHVTPEAFYRAITDLAPEGMSFLVTVTSAEEPATPDPDSRPPASIITIRAVKTRGADGKRANDDEQFLEVYDIGDFAKRDPAAVERMMDAIALAVEMDGGASPTLRLHAPTNLLLVRGTLYQIQVVGAVVHKLLASEAQP